MTLSDDAFAELRAEWDIASKAIWAGQPDRTDLMLPLSMLTSQWTTMDMIIRAVAQETGVGGRSIRSDIKTKKVCMARHLVTFIASDIGRGLSDTKLSGIVGRDRSTITHSVRRAAELMERDRQYKAAYRRVMARLGTNPELVS